MYLQRSGNMFKKIMKFSFITNDDVSKENDNSFVDLTPTDSAESVGHYISALKWAIKNKNIKNIAITGPYGSGKTSIIKTFEKINRYRFLNISLASFKEEAELDNIYSNEKNIMIERSILQQMLYSADATKLQYSRFKRINVPDKSEIKSFLFVFWLLTLVYLYNNLLRFAFESQHTNPWQFLIDIVAIAYGLGFFVVNISDIHKSTFGIMLKKVSLRNAEIETDNVPEASILNRHLDEIIYFFHVMKYDVVVIEDLDRFGSPEIFVKLREINKLINDSTRRNKPIKFLYALKDDMFVHKNRAKFFDFIIPVVPVINSTNSFDKMIDRINKEPLCANVEEQFLREVSFYIDDLRLMNNIFNEYVIYANKLSSKGMNVTKMLAVMIYKNMFPNDFENLHHGRGALADVCAMRTKLISNTRQNIAHEIAELQGLVNKANKEETSSIEELIDIFIGHIVSSSGHESLSGIFIDNEFVTFSQLQKWDVFEKIFEIKDLAVAKNIGRLQRVQLGKSFVQLQEEVMPGHTFAQRRKNIENKSPSVRVDIQNKIHQLKKDSTNLAKFPLCEILRKNNFSVDDVFADNKISDARLLRYLIYNGYLDENYYLYTSNFYEGRKTKTDHDFLLEIRDFRYPGARHPIDNPEEVVKCMRDEDFNKISVLNVALVDTIMSDPVKYNKHIDSAVDYISSNFNEAEEFFAIYWDIGKCLKNFAVELSSRWPAYGIEATKYDQAPNHVAYILSYVKGIFVSKEMNSNNSLTNYISANGNLVFETSLMSLENYDVLKMLNVKFLDISNFAGNASLLEYILKNDLYLINAMNIEVLLHVFSVNKKANKLDYRKANYTEICSSEINELVNYIDNNLSYYVDNVYLALADNTNESLGAIQKLISCDKINEQQKQDIVFTQENIFKNFDGVPKALWSFIIKNEKIAFSWENIAEYYRCTGDDDEVLTELLNKDYIVTRLSDEKIKESWINEDDYQEIVSYVLENDGIKDQLYCQLLKCITCLREDFPDEISERKMFCLAQAGIVELNEQTFERALSDIPLITVLISTNIDAYLASKETYPINDDIRSNLLLCNLNASQKYEICKDVSVAGLESSRETFSCVESAILLNASSYAEFDPEIVSRIIIGASTIESSVKILTKCIETYDKNTIFGLLSRLPKPFCVIAVPWKSPKILKTQANLQLAKALKAHGLISSITEQEKFIKIYTFRSGG